MHHAAEEMVGRPVHCPFIVDDLRQGSGLENFDLLRVGTELHQGYILIDLLAFFCDIKINLWKQINAVFDLDNFCCVFYFIFLLKFGLREHSLIV